MPEKYIVITVIGPDRSQLIAEITSVIADFNYNIEDMDQVVMHNIFILSLLVNIAQDVANYERLRKKLQYRCQELGLEVNFYYAGEK
ncbi:MAG: ACT domain-containing protein [Candidatus Methanomethylicus sp.]|nr:ACT domain-containing protein [Candidatus Methanomethylicus sp.]